MVATTVNAASACDLRHRFLQSSAAAPSAPALRLRCQDRRQSRQSASLWRLWRVGRGRVLKPRLCRDCPAQPFEQRGVISERALDPDADRPSEEGQHADQDHGSVGWAFHMHFQAPFMRNAKEPVCAPTAVHGLDAGSQLVQNSIVPFEVLPVAMLASVTPPCE